LATTSTDTVQLPPAATVARSGKKELKDTELPPAVAETVPPQVFETLSGLATSSPEGKLSLNDSWLAAEEFAVLSMVKVRVLRPPKATALGKKLLEKPGRSAATVRSALAGPLEPLSHVRFDVVFVCVPTVELVTLTVITQELEGARSPASKVIDEPPLAAVTEPTHPVEAFAGEAIVTPAGRLSVNARPRAPVEVEFVMMNCSVVTLPGPMVLGTKDLLKATVDWPNTAGTETKLTTSRAMQSRHGLQT
jgi:hypothetical protein